MFDFLESTHLHFLVSCSDLQEVDESMHRSLIWLLENTVDESMALTFSVDYDKGGEFVTHQLIPNGSDIEVCCPHCSCHKSTYITIHLNLR